MIDINTATKEQLQGLPGVGPKTAERIISSRPVAGPDELEALVPPSSWLKVQEALDDLVFSSITEVPEEQIEEELGEEFDESGVESYVPLLSPERLLELKRHVDEAVERGGLIASRPLRMGGADLRRIRHGDTAYFESKFGTGATFLCLWNMSWGPSLEAMNPNDQPTQAEISLWFEEKGIHIQFAHFGPSIQVGTRSRGFVPIVIFEVIEEQDEDEKKGGDNADG